MAQPWYQKTLVQTALVTGVFGLLIAWIADHHPDHDEVLSRTRRLLTEHMTSAASSKDTPG